MRRRTRSPGTENLGFQREKNPVTEQIISVLGRINRYLIRKTTRSIYHFKLDHICAFSMRIAFSAVIIYCMTAIHEIISKIILS